MKKIICFIAVVVIFSTLGGCAAVCNPQNPGAAIRSGHPLGLAVGLAQFGACTGYFLAKRAMSDDQNINQVEK